MTASAAPRGRKQMAAIAAAVIQAQGGRSPGAYRMSGKLQVRELERREGLSIYGDGNRSIIIVAADDVATGELGNSDGADIQKLIYYHVSAQK